MKEMLYAVRCLKSNEEVMGSNPVESPEFFRFTRQLLKIVQQVRGSYLHLISNTALHITFLSVKCIFTY